MTTPGNISGGDIKMGDLNAHNPDITEADVFEAVVDRVPDNAALTMDGDTLTYRELDEAANRMGHMLLAHGAVANDNIALYMRNITEHMTAMIGCMKARLVGINVNYRYTADELAYLFSDSKSVAVMVEAAFADTMARVVPRCPDLKTVYIVGETSDELRQACESAGVELVSVDDELSTHSAERDFDPRSGDDHWIIYTGGTTGMPKGVVWRAADYYYSCLSGGNPYGEPRHTPEEVAENAVNGAAIVAMISAPLMHGAGSFVNFTFFNLGGHLIMHRDFDPVAVLRTIEEYKAIMLVFVGDGMGVPIADAMLEHKDDIDFTSVVFVSSGGGIWSKSAREKLLSVLPNAILRDNFGASEAGNDGAFEMNEAGQVRLPPSDKVFVVDDDLKPLTPGSDTIGSIVRRGHVPIGYYGDPEKTARTFPVIDGVRVSLLGDMGKLEEDGSILFLGRGSGCINTGGEKVFPEEVEQALKSHPAVFDAVVAGIPDERFGQAVSAVVQFREGEQATADELREYLRGVLANYKVPKRIVDVPQVKRSPAGKADYRWAKATLEQS